MLLRDQFILEALKDLDLSPTMEKNARDKYQAIAGHINDYGIETDFYPQGSFQLGTVIRPYKDGHDLDYDLDVLSISPRDKQTSNPSVIKNEVGDAIKANGVYSEKLQSEDTVCWTLKYAKVSQDIGFSLDIVPCVHADQSEKFNILSAGTPYDIAMKAIAITKKQYGQYEWQSSNPLGFGDWFLNISNKHLSYESKQTQYRNLLFELSSIYASIEDIPHYYYRSNLQRAVQMIKRHRDIYYDRAYIRNEKPSSMLIAALVADSVKDRDFLSIAQIIEFFIDGYEHEAISIMDNGRVVNPTDSREDLIVSYSAKRKDLMQKWISSLRSLFSIEDEQQFKRALHNDVNTRAFTEVSQGSAVSPTKPWSM
ncbi:MAG: nucleotidyltransferase [Peptoniphilaceae bacterium]|nr:nucleotidyltransferase [Peptoniphilaceae bacterium]MDY3075505.1 nucleotidyltransferase [Peptoniphilaceae bacterium]